MRLPLATLLVLIAASPAANAANYATCLLDKLPGVQNHGATVSAVRVCQSKYPGGLASVEQGAGRGLFASYDSSDECIYDKAKDTRFAGAVKVIGQACARLYSKPIHPDSAYWKQFQVSPAGSRQYTDEKGVTRRLVPFDGEFTPIDK